MSRLARALWIEIFLYAEDMLPDNRRGSREPCGLKYPGPGCTSLLEESRLARALWIEIVSIALDAQGDMSRLARALWIEIESATQNYNDALASRLARALWIEILSISNMDVLGAVEARESLVD